MVKKKNIEELAHQRLHTSIDDIKKLIDMGSIPKNATRKFKVGDSVKIGALKNIIVTEVLFNGLAYVIHYDYMGTEYGQPSRKIGDGVWSWLDVFPTTSFSDGVPMRIKDDIIINYYNNSIDSLLHKMYKAGIDMNPEYQRGLVWSLKQKYSLLDSIFNNVDIGKFTFIANPYDSDKTFHYEILDGKQRLATICQFYEDRITWNGKYYSELCFLDSNHFDNYPIIQGEISKITEEQIYKLFIKMNTSGEPIEKKHLNKVKSLIKK